MSRSTEYQHFLDLIDGRATDDLPKDQETVASSQEVGWWQQHQVRRALRNYRSGEATFVDFGLVRDKTGIIFSRKARKRMKRLRG